MTDVVGVDLTTVEAPPMVLLLNKEFRSSCLTRWDADLQSRFILPLPSHAPEEQVHSVLRSKAPERVELGSRHGALRQHDSIWRSEQRVRAKQRDLEGLEQVLLAIPRLELEEAKSLRLHVVQRARHWHE